MQVKTVTVNSGI